MFLFVNLVMKISDDVQIKSSKHVNEHKHVLGNKLFQVLEKYQLPVTSQFNMAATSTSGRSQLISLENGQYS